jgi:tryptophan 2,3-dioxygenase
MEITPQLAQHLRALEDKFGATGQDLASYIEGLRHASYLTYWDYIHLDTLLSLQHPRTDFPDEVIFIGYHQITELYLKLILHELRQLDAADTWTEDFVLGKLHRVNNYFRTLAQSFDVMTHGMDTQQFLQFRMALLPASGFQSAQIRELEFRCTSLFRLLNDEARTESSEAEVTANPLGHYEQVYWKYGNLSAATGQKTLTLRMFEDKYDGSFQSLIERMQGRNLRERLWQYWSVDESSNASRKPPLPTAVREALKRLDLGANVYWRLSHYKAAARYLQRDPEDIRSTGGTNWQQYLPPRFQRISFFPELWNEEELAEWGKSWVLDLFAQDVERHWHLAQ